MGITREQYEAAIPKCCAYQTIETHENIMLCWGLARAVEEGRKMNCDNCTENTMKSDTGETEPDGCDHCRNPLFAGRKCKNCGKVHWADELPNRSFRGGPEARPAGNDS